MKLTSWLVVLLCACVALPAAAQGRATTKMPAAAQGRAITKMRFQVMDRNKDGAIARDEWSGNDRSFRNHDWNGDGRLSGEEVRPGAVRNPRWDDRSIEDSIDQDNDFSVARFRTLDHNRDGRLSGDEWHGRNEVYWRLDRNRDGYISTAEFTAGDDSDFEDRFSDLDTNDDGRVTNSEWHGTEAVFQALDSNRDGVLTRAEALGTGRGDRDEFRRVDANNDGAIARDEWHWNAAAFDRLDANRDKRLSRQEFQNSPEGNLAQESEAYRAGYARGRPEGIQAGKEDKPRGWDLEGQRELEHADSGYQSASGNYVEYQAGYRAGFRRGYPEGFGPR
jgi:Ca2+-binding EF-hand superfamily protein